MFFDLPPVDIGLKEEVRTEVVTHLRKIVSDEYVLYTKLYNYHWNVVGPFFGPLHAFFESLFGHKIKQVDLFAERIRALGHLAPGAMAEFLELTRLKEAGSKAQLSDSEMIRDLLKDYETIARHVRSDIEIIEKLGDKTTVNMLEEKLMQDDKDAWMLRSLATQVMPAGGGGGNQEKRAAKEPTPAKKMPEPETMKAEATEPVEQSQAPAAAAEVPAEELTPAVEAEPVQNAPVVAPPLPPLTPEPGLVTAGKLVEK